ncbi:RNA polymerase sigma factor [Nocardioides sp. T2.26MG-1]|uniref:RNA polymerase sigma factor n=1 Tax=Nocardioides sp. T2.26MG-1 TaxID=3041166 RepID=UPI002477B1C6|nr:RNA polymerase sigma factor [Nocardioides sp. T2.26MG-1]CAI9411843.1 ECF RNA polymerase sigma factor SigE [Nocardioides sp. T2.26MG-1]
MPTSPRDTERDADLLDALVARARDGDQAALEELLARIRPMVLGRCRRFLPYPEDAEEAAQDALLTIATKLDQFTGRGSFRGWVVVVTSNAARGTYRSLRRRAGERTADLLPEQPDPRTTSVIAGTRLDLLDALEELEGRSPTVVEPFVLRDLGGLTYDEIAAATGAPMSAVKDRIHRARTQLRGMLGDR